LLLTNEQNTLLMEAITNKKSLPNRRKIVSDTAKNKDFKVSEKFTFNIVKVTTEEILSNRSGVYPFWI